MEFKGEVMDIDPIVVGKDNPVVKIGNGTLQGSAGKSRDGRDFHQFKGIPYGKIVERFQPSVPTDPWTGVFNATEYGPICAQYDCYNQKFTGEENCLNVNVFTPKLPQPGQETELLPVALVLHLGNHFFGSSQNYNPAYFMDQNVVVVTLNYRLGLFGYLNLGDKNVAGNMGLKDQTLALRWVQENIGYFCGDRERVTLMGSDSGGTDVILHLLNPEDKGLFHRAVVQSATINSSSFVKDPAAQAKKLGEQVGWKGMGSGDFVEFLKKMEPLEILKMMKMPDENMFDFEGMEKFAVFAPTVDGEIITKHPFDLIKRGKVVNKVPLILGAAVLDGLDPLVGMILNDTKLWDDVIRNWDVKSPLLLDFKNDVQDPATVAQKIWEFYAKEGKLSGLDFIQMFTDKHYEYLLRLIAHYWNGILPLYVFRFNHMQTPNRAVDQIGYANMPNGPGHWDDLQYLFNMSSSFNVPPITKDSESVDYILSKGMVRMWTSFFEMGKPSKPWGEGKEWEQFRVEAKKANKIYEIDVMPKMVEDTEDFQNRMEFWDTIFKNDLSTWGGGN